MANERCPTPRTWVPGVLFGFPAAPARHETLASYLTRLAALQALREVWDAVSNPQSRTRRRQVHAERLATLVGRPVGHLATALRTAAAFVHEVGRRLGRPDYQPSVKRRRDHPLDGLPQLAAVNRRGGNVILHHRHIRPVLIRD